MSELYWGVDWNSTISSSVVLRMDDLGVWDVVESTSAADCAAIEHITELL